MHIYVAYIDIYIKQNNACRAYSVCDLCVDVYTLYGLMQLIFFQYLGIIVHINTYGSTSNLEPLCLDMSQLTGFHPWMFFFVPVYGRPEVYILDRESLDQSF